MMNKLWVRLTFAFVAITLLSVALVAALASAVATDQFTAYLSGQQVMNEAALSDDLTAYYRQNGSWDGVGALISASDAGGIRRGRGAMGGMGVNGAGQMRGATAVTLANAAGAVVYGDHIGQSLPEMERSQALPISVGGATVGYLLVTSPGRMILNQAQQAFIDQLQRNVTFAALAAVVLATILGLLVSRALATPLAGLSLAARAFAKRDWTFRAPLRGTQETADVALALNQMAESLQKAERNRRDMVADIAHELRTPVTVIQGNLRAMLDGVYPLELAEVATLYDETLLLNRLIDDLRELALAEAGQLQINIQPTDTATVLRTTAERFTALAGAQDVGLTVQSADTLPLAQVDPDRLAQVLRILLVNALRYTPAGKSVVLAVAGAPGAFGMLRVSVTDTGAGIVSEDLTYVFDRFYRGDKSRTRASGGSGLGLAIARSLVEVMGGQIGVESTLGQGSSFWFTVPVTRSENK
jgi:signal transduction histidine kinase